MAALTQQSVRITNVRQGTGFPGVDAEDYLLVRALASICQAETPGLAVGADTLTFHPTCHPRPLRGVLEVADGSRMPNALVLLSTLTPVLARAGAMSSLYAKGETYGANSLTFDYYQKVGLRALQAVGIYAAPELLRAGYGRERPGEVSLEIEPSALRGALWEQRGSLKECGAIVTTSRLPDAAIARGVSHLLRMAAVQGIPMTVDSSDVPADQAGAFITCWAIYEGGAGGATAMGTRGLRIEHLAQQAFESLVRWMETDSTVDPYLADQLLIPAAFSERSTTFKTSRLTRRFLTSIWAVKQFIPLHVILKGKEDEPGVVTIRR
jgi:RNA 3'-terminal phosphate cyclase (ATP)